MFIEGRVVSADAVSRARGWRWVLSTGVLISLCALVLVASLASARSLDLYGFDFHGQYLGGARAIVHGEPLYKPAGDIDYREALDYVYPPLLAVAVVPFTALPEHAAVVLAVVGCMCAAFGALAIVGLRDPRCYLAVLASAPAWNLMETANVTALLVLGVALAWRFRTTVWPLAIVLGLSVAAKLLVWPLLAWAALSGRRRSAALALVVAMSATVATWAIVGFQGLGEYPQILRGLDDTWAPESYSIVGIATQLHVGIDGARLVMALVGGSLLVGCWWFARQRDERRAFTAAVVATLALTPIVWVHYLWLLLVPLALAQPQFSAVWLLPLLAWVVPRVGNGSGLEPFVPAGIAVVLAAYMLVPRPARGVTVQEA